MIKVMFHDGVDDKLLKFAVIVAKADGKWIFCKHKARDTYEIPGGHREAGETIDETARRELYEETGAIEFDLVPVGIYSVCADGEETYGKLYCADAKAFEAELHSEIEKIIITKDLPEAWTHPEIQPELLKEAKRRGFC